jgi:hypothetical protein
MTWSTSASAGPSPEELEDEELRGVVAIIRRALQRRGLL